MVCTDCQQRCRTGALSLPASVTQIGKDNKEQFLEGLDNCYLQALGLVLQNAPKGDHSNDTYFIYVSGCH